MHDFIVRDLEVVVELGIGEHRVPGPQPRATLMTQCDRPRQAEQQVKAVLPAAGYLPATPMVAMGASALTKDGQRTQLCHRHVGAEVRGAPAGDVHRDHRGGERLDEVVQPPRCGNIIRGPAQDGGRRIVAHRGTSLGTFTDPSASVLQWLEHGWPVCANRAESMA